MRYSKDQTEAEDNLQEGFIKVFQKIDSFRHQGSFEGWMRRIMVNVSLEKFRKKHTMYPVEDMEKFDSAEEEFNEVELSTKDLMKLIRASASLSHWCLNLYVFESMNHKEIAKELGISEGTSKSNLARARIILKDRIKNELIDAENYTA